MRLSFEIHLSLVNGWICRGIEAHTCFPRSPSVYPYRWRSGNEITQGLARNDTRSRRLQWRVSQGFLAPLFPSIFALCCHVPAAFPHLFPITYRLTAYPLPSIPPPPQKTRRRRRNSIQTINNHVLCVTLSNSVKLTSRVLFLPRLDLFNVAINSSRILELLLTLPLRWWPTLRDTYTHTHTLFILEIYFYNNCRNSRALIG